MFISTARRRSSARALVVLATVSVTLMVTVLAAGAHGGAASISVEATPAPDGVVDVRARVKYSADGHGVEAAAVIVQPSQPDGTPLGVVAMQDQGDGYYYAQLSLPSGGDWTLVVSSEEPAVRSEVVVAVTKATADTAPNGDPLVVAPADGNENARDNGASADDVNGADEAENEADSSSFPWVWVVLGVIILIAIAVGPIAASRARAKSEAP